ncbi:MAG: tRNA threonylcarbamoyladenosine biosynthesis protein TsaB [Alphaproteobacteria bacterium MarineAlpha11_Bin1]|nr:MAG: tRNA threonylcarbamoyladenosine biosynthesis protein TsaB [Alphaproteobacteria bacterium MarineAlpha11_Bin1]
MRKILSIDTSADFCGVAILRGESVLSRHSLAMSRGHAEALIPLVKNLCADANITPSAFDLISVTIGPGSFTGVRTGISAAKGFALVADCPAIGVSSLHAVAAAVPTNDAQPILIVLDTRRADYFVQLFDRDTTPIDLPSTMDSIGIRELIRIHRPVVAGNALGRLRKEESISGMGDFESFSGDGVPDPVLVAGIAEKIIDSRRVASNTLAPLYLRSPEAKIPRWGGRLKNKPSG